MKAPGRVADAADIYLFNKLLTIADADCRNISECAGEKRSAALALC